MGLEFNIYANIHGQPLAKTVNPSRRGQMQDRNSISQIDGGSNNLVGT